MMKTVTFYSYKGGVGRTLALVNIAKRFAEFNKKVCLLDFDLEAPGICHKFKDILDYSKIQKGLVDYISNYQTKAVIPKKIKPYIIPIDLGIKDASIIDFLPAGNIRSTNYWRNLALINWGDLFYKECSEGVLFFLDLKEKIKKELKPDILLIDTRTGITEISAITLSLFADEAVIMAAHNDEGIEGSLQIINSVINNENNFKGSPPKIHFVINRLPLPSDPNERTQESNLIVDLKTRMNDYFKTKSSNFSLDEILIIHSDRELEIQERIKIGYDFEEEFKQSSIGSDYLNLFHRLTKDILKQNEIEKFNIINKSEFLTYQAQKKLQDKDYEYSQQLLAEAIKTNPDNHDAMILLGYLLFDLGKAGEALEYSEKAISLNPKIGRAHVLKALILNNLEKKKEATKSIDEAIKLDINNPFPYFFKIELEREIGETNENLLSALDNLIKQFPKFAQFYLLRSEIFLDSDLIDNAFNDIYTTLSLNPELDSGYLLLAELYLLKDNLNEFYLNFEHALKLEASISGRIQMKKDIYSKIFNDKRFISILEKYEKTKTLEFISSFNKK